MAATMDPTEGVSPFTTKKIIPKFKSSAKFPEQRLRHNAPSFRLEDGSHGEDFVNVESLLSSLEELEGDYGSYAPVTPVNASEEKSAESRHNSSKLFGRSPESNASKSDAAVKDNAPRAVTVKPSDFFKMGRGKMTKITKSLAKRIEIGGECRPSTIVSPTYTPRHGSNLDLSSCNSDAETEIQNNLTSRFVGTEVSSVDGDIAETEAWNSLVSTFVGKEDSLAEGREFCSTNSLCEVDKLSGSKNKVGVQPKALITTVHCDGEIELLYSSASTMKDINSRAAVYSRTDSPLSSSSQSSITTASSSSKGSSSSISSQGILLPPKRAIGGYDPFGNSDFSIPTAARPQRRVHFSNMNKLNETSALDDLVKARASGTLSSDLSDDSSTSFEYLANWCGATPGDFEEV